MGMPIVQSQSVIIIERIDLESLKAKYLMNCSAKSSEETTTSPKEDIITGQKAMKP